MITQQLFLICVIGLIAVYAADDKLCSERVQHYFELGCTPVYSETNKICPVRFDCPFMKPSHDKTKCHYGSKVYNMREEIANNEIKNPCFSYCTCERETFSKPRPSFKCNRGACSYKRGPGCVYQFKLDNCCVHRSVCDPYAVKNLKTCKWAGKEYKEGEVIYPLHTNKKCICNGNFNGTIESLECSVHECGTQLYHMSFVYEKCAPVYAGVELFKYNCPLFWKCSEGWETFEKTAVEITSPEMKCYYGNKELFVGDKYTNKGECMTCTCKIPPLVTCINDENCSDLY